MTEITFEDFQSRINMPIQKLTGFDHNDFIDAPWYDLYEQTAGEPTDQQIIDTLSEADFLFKAMIEDMKNPAPSDKITMESIIGGQIAGLNTAREELGDVISLIQYDTESYSPLKMKQFNEQMDKLIRLDCGKIISRRDHIENCKPSAKKITNNQYQHDRIRYFRMDNPQQEKYEARLKAGRTRWLKYTDGKHDMNMKVKKVVFDAILIPVAEGSL